MTQKHGKPFNMAEYCIGRSAGTRPEHAALIVTRDALTAAPVEMWTYHDLENAVLRVAAALIERGFEKGSRILIRLDNTSTYPILLFGANAAGLVPVAASSQLTAAEAEFLLADCDARAVALAADLPRGEIPPHVAVLEEADVRAMMRHRNRATYAATDEEDPGYMLYTSGTTARPKGVVHAQRVAIGRSPTYQSWYGITPDDRMLHAGAFNWTYTLGTGLIDPWANGATSIIYAGTKSPEIWPALICSSGATLFAAVPSLMRQILKYAAPGPIDLGKLRHGLIAGEKPPPDLFDAWKSRTGTELYEALGMSEISTYISTSPTVPRKGHTAGKPQKGRRIVILPVEDGTDPLPPGQEGLIAIHRSDPGLMLGYWNRPDEERDVYRGEWFIGGDLGVEDDEGYITHVGRSNDIIKALGYRIAPQEIEAVLSHCPGVAEVACTEVRVRADVSIVGAFIVRQPGSQLTAQAVHDFATERLAAYKRPREVFFVDALPRTSNGKVKRSALSAAHAHSG